MEDYDNENSDSEDADYNQARKGGVTQIFQIPPKVSKESTTKDEKVEIDANNSPESSFNLTEKINQMQLGDREDTIY